MILFGASGHSKVVLDILKLNGKNVNEIFDDNPRCSEIFGIPVHDSKNAKTDDDAIITIGNNSSRRNIATKYFFNYITAIHPLACVSSYASVASGTVVMAHAVVNPSAVIGKHCIINTGAVVEHDCLLEDYVHISPNASLAGNVTVGEGSHIGIGASVIQGVKIGKWCTIGAGSVVIRDIPDYATAVGNPAKIIKFNHSI